jgi:hypothetical protein
MFAGGSILRRSNRTLIAQPMVGALKISPLSCKNSECPRQGSNLRAFSLEVAQTRQHDLSATAGMQRLRRHLASDPRDQAAHVDGSPPPSGGNDS